jgi:hypothetical protein
MHYEENHIYDKEFKYDNTPYIYITSLPFLNKWKHIHYSETNYKKKLTLLILGILSLAIIAIILGLIPLYLGK